VIITHLASTPITGINVGDVKYKLNIREWLVFYYQGVENL